MGLFDGFNLGALSSLADPELQKMITDMPKRVEEWTKFLIKLDAALRAIQAQNSAADNKLQFTCDMLGEISDKLTLLMSESNITPELQSEVMEMSLQDPRNRMDFVPRYDKNGSIIGPIS